MGKGEVHNRPRPCGCGREWELILGRYPRRSLSLVDPGIVSIPGNRARGFLSPQRKILDGPSLVDPFLSRLKRPRLSFRFSSNPPFVRIRTRDLSLLPTRDVNRPPPFSRVPKDTPSVLFPVRKGDLDRPIGRRFPFRHLHVPRRIVFVLVTTSDVHDTCEPSTCTCKTTRGARDKVETKKQVVSWNKETVPPAW